MELERGREDGSTLVLRWKGHVLSTEASMICLILACCRCDRLPAFLFTRPYSPRRRWNNNGEIELADPPSTVTIPRWPLDLFVDATELPGFGKDDSPEGSRRGVPSSRTLEPPWRLSPSIEHLCQNNVISIEVDGEDLSFRMVESRREEIWEQTRAEDRLLLWFDLLKLTIYSSPDAFAEISWKSILGNCKPVTETTLIPFLSVLEWTHLQHHSDIIPRLVSFLLHFSIFNGFSVDTSVYLAPDLLRRIESSCSIAVKNMLDLLKFKELLCLHLLHLHEEGRKRPSDPLATPLQTTEMLGILGLLLASVLRSNRNSIHSNEAIDIAHRWREGHISSISTMCTFARELLFMDEPNNQSSSPSITLGKADIQVRFSMAMAMIERNHFTQAYAMLNACAADLRIPDSDYQNEYFPVMTELVKCCNILKQEEQGKATALEALQHRRTYTAALNQIYHMQIALTDSLIGQSKYLEAEKILQQILASECLSNYLTTVASLRLNKARRRLGVLDFPAFDRNGALQKVLTYGDDYNGHIRDECLEELSCTIGFTQQRTSEDETVANAVLNTASAVIASHSNSASSWRTRILHEQIAHESGHRMREPHRQHTAEMSVDARSSLSRAPLRILLLHEKLKSSIPGPNTLSHSQALQRPMLALDDVSKYMNVEGNGIAITTTSKRELTVGMLDLSLNLILLQAEQDFPVSIASILHMQGFTGPEFSDWRGKPSWALFQRFLLDVSMPRFVPAQISLPEMMHFLVAIREESHLGVGQEKSLRSCTLRTLGPPRSDERDVELEDAIGISQTSTPTSSIVTRAEDADQSFAWCKLETDGIIMLPHPTCKSMKPSRVKIGRFIEDMDRPATNYYDSALKSHMEGAVWIQGSDRIWLDTFDDDSLNGYVLTTDEIRFYWSICTHLKTNPIFAEPSEKKLLMDWVSVRNVVYFITGYQTYTDTKIYQRREDVLVASAPRMFLDGEVVAAICVREVTVVQPPDGEATLEFGDEFWRIYWGLVDKEAESIIIEQRSSDIKIRDLAREQRAHAWYTSMKKKFNPSVKSKKTEVKHSQHDEEVSE